MKQRQGEYRKKGDYHKHLDLKWPYYPVYIEKMRIVKERLDKVEKTSKIVDLGCGEGLLVEQYSQKGYSNIVGLDSHYTSKHVKNGNILEMPFHNKTFDYALCLDVLEHLSYSDQEKAIFQISNILKKKGVLIVSVPNLSHLASRISFLFTGKLLRTSTIERHIGDRPASEYKELLAKHFTIEKHIGLFPTYPLISLLTIKSPQQALPLHKLYNKTIAYPNWCFLGIFICKKL